MSRLRIREVVVVEGKYDAVKLADIVDGLILPVGGFSVFTSEETKQLLRRLGRERGLLILTDSDAAGFRIRAYINKLAQGLDVKNAYIPALAGKEPRKPRPSGEGLLGVEGVPADVIVRAIRAAGVCEAPARSEKRPITYADLYEQGLSGTQNSAEARRAWLASIGLPPRISKKGLLEALNSLYTYEEFLTTVARAKARKAQEG